MCGAIVSRIQALKPEDNGFSAPRRQRAALVRRLLCPLELRCGGQTATKISFAKRRRDWGLWRAHKASPHGAYEVDASAS